MMTKTEIEKMLDNLTIKPKKTARQKLLDLGWKETPCYEVALKESENGGYTTFFKSDEEHQNETTVILFDWARNKVSVYNHFVNRTENQLGWIDLKIAKILKQYLEELK